MSALEPNAASRWTLFELRKALNYAKGFHLSFALSRPFAPFVVPNMICGQRPHQTHLQGFTELSTKANPHAVESFLEV